MACKEGQFYVAEPIQVLKLLKISINLNDTDMKGMTHFVLDVHIQLLDTIL